MKGEFVTRLRVLAAALVLAAGCHPSSEPEATTGRLQSLNRHPLSGSRIRITGCPEQVTASDGSFSTTCAAAVYDVAATTSSFGIVYQGITRRDPLVTLPVLVGSDGWTSVYGTVEGRTDGREAGVSITSTAWASGVKGLGAAPNGFFSSDVYWFAESPSVTIRALEWTATLGVPIAFTAYGDVRVPLVAGTLATGSPALEPISSGTLSLSLDAAHPEQTRVDLWAEWPEGEVSTLGTVGGWAFAVDVPTPDVLGAAFTAVAVEETYGASSSGYASGWRRGVPATAAPPSILVPAASVFTAPLAETLVDLSTEFTYTAVPDAAYLLAFESGVQSHPKYYVVTSATTARIPDFTWAGLPTPRWSGATYYTASVSALGPYSSVDDVAATPLPVEPDLWSWQKPFAMTLPPSDGFATRHRMSVQVWQP